MEKTAIIRGMSCSHCAADDVIKNAVDDVGYEVTQITAFSEK